MIKPKCVILIEQLIQAIKDTNHTISVNLNDPTVNQHHSCVLNNMSYDFFLDSLHRRWQRIIDSHVSKYGQFSCIQNAQRLYNVRDYVPSISFKEAEALVESPEKIKQHVNADVQYEVLLELLKDTSPKTVIRKTHVGSDLISFISYNCNCQFRELFAYMFSKYKSKYKVRLAGKQKEQQIECLREDAHTIKQLFANGGCKGDLACVFRYLDTQSTQQSLPGGTISDYITRELQVLIPDDMGALKHIVIKIMGKYFEDIHPIVWTQMAMHMFCNLFTELPLTTKEVNNFVWKNILLNSGPMILKLLQMIQPFLSEEHKNEYGLNKLTYPVIAKLTVDQILNDSLLKPAMFETLKDFSASVGHVRISRNVTTGQKMVVKLIKPLSFIQGCWEYSSLHDLFPQGTDERKYITNMLRSNGDEMDLREETTNMESAKRKYRCTYKEIFGINVTAILTSIEPVAHVLNPGLWQLVAITLAPGKSLDDIITDPSYDLSEPSLFKASLCRCMDLLVQSFFFNVIDSGFYHGDLHAGNIFFSFEKRQATIIDWGAVGHLNVVSNDKSMVLFRKIVVMIVYSNYTGIFDAISKYIGEDTLDMLSPDYVRMKEKLHQAELQNIKGSEDASVQFKEFAKDIMSNTVVLKENCGIVVDAPSNTKDLYKKSIYDYYDNDNDNNDKYKDLSNVDTVIETCDIDLDVYDQKVGKQTGVTFSWVLSEMLLFYTKNGVNLQFVFPELFEFQKGYILLQGVLSKIGYTSKRTSIAIINACLKWSHLKKLLHVKVLIELGLLVRKEQSLYYKRKNNHAMNISR